MTGKSTQGPIQAVICPNCGQPNDMRDLPAQQLLDTGSSYWCDRCNRLMEVIGIAQVTVITVRPASEAKVLAAGPPPSAPRLPVGARRLLRGGRK